MFAIVDETDGTFWVGSGDFEADGSRAVRFPTETQARATAAMLQDEVFEDLKLTVKAV
jgi:hypothetical protein